jgi:uncharacterized protein YndB with AHSA1/START domain
MTSTAGDRRGEISTGPDGRRRLVFRRSWPDPAADVWAALTDPERSARWIGRYDGERAAGAEGPFTMTAEDGAPVGRVRIEECAPPHRLVLRFLDEVAWRIELDLTEDGGRTTLLFTQVLPDDTGLADIATGWHWYLDRLEAVLTGAPPPPAWEQFQAAVGPAYAAGGG